MVLPHWRYTWDARRDTAQWGHRWNSAPEVVCRLYLKHWSHVSDLEQLNTLKCELAGNSCSCLCQQELVAEQGSRVQGLGEAEKGSRAQRKECGAMLMPLPCPPWPCLSHLFSPFCADRMSYDFVLRKKGKWEPFSQAVPSYVTGRGLYCRNKFIGPPNMPPPRGNAASCTFSGH